jgi:uncharacterized protein
LSNFIKAILISIGSLSVALGVIGIFLPILPTTPFFLLGAACYVRGSEKLYNWLITNRLIGNYIKNYREGKGIPVKTKAYAITLLWISISYSTIFLISRSLIRCILIIIAASVTWHILSIKPIKEPELKEEIDFQEEL